MNSSPSTAFAITTLLVAAAAHAGTTSSISGVQNSSGIDYTRSDRAGYVVQAAHTDRYNAGTSTIAVDAIADYGVLEAAVSATGQGQSTIGRVDATSGFGDRFEIDVDVAGLTGQPGHFTAKVATPFTASVSLEPDTVGRLQAFVEVNETEGWSEQFGSANGAFSTNVFHDGVQEDVGTPMLLDVAFIFGQPIALLGFMDVQVTGQMPIAGGSFSGTVDAPHSLYWKGISEITDRLGNRVTGYTLTSNSGTD
jgi:hypothetical protein